MRAAGHSIGSVLCLKRLGPVEQHSVDITTTYLRENARCLFMEDSVGMLTTLRLYKNAGKNVEEGEVRNYYFF